MLMVRSSHGRVLYSSLRLINQRSLFSTSRRATATTAAAADTDATDAAKISAASNRLVEKAILEARGPVAEQLAATGVWLGHGQRRPGRPTASAATGADADPTLPKTRKRRSRGQPKPPTGDKTRVHITGDKLCDDVLSYIGPSLERHRGCDILDLYPGAGLWSRKLNEFLQPRSHVLLEPDHELYEPFLRPLLDQPGTKLVPKSGIIWRELSSVLTPEHLPHQRIPDNLDERNDTLLVIANLAFHPKKRFLNFDSMASLVLHQFVSAIHTGGLFQRYGLVRMLIWTRTDDKLSFLPRNIQRQRRQAIENNLMCEWVHEVCGGEAASASWFARDEAIDEASLLATVKRMRAAKIKLPPGRESESYKAALARVKAKKAIQKPGTSIPTFKRPYLDMLADMEAASVEGVDLDEDPTDRRAKQLYQWRANADLKRAERVLDISRGLDNIIALHQAKSPDAEEIAAAELQWLTDVRESPKAVADDFITYRDNLHAFRKTPPLLQWDRRSYEPMTVQAEEFFPNVHCSLLDIQPKAPHPLLRQTGPSSNRAADMFDIILGSLVHQASQPLASGLDSLWPGSSDYILPRWTSGQDLSRGGFPLHLRHAEPAPRMLDARQWEELLELWMAWPFRPEFNDLVGRTHDEASDKEDDSGQSDV
ncbi:S-adenosyl-L-methionine-dependent methyltransferase [Nemania sp. NC0429]|nr:S-adenosyl-L-methionine-dependent methyltransferase [Nemania sp. NC0429]